MDGFRKSLASEPRRRAGLAFLTAVETSLMHWEDGNKGKRERRREEGRDELWAFLLNSVRPGPRSQLVYSTCQDWACVSDG